MPSRTIDWEEDLMLSGRHILARKGERDHIRDEDGEVLIALPETVQNKHYWCRIKSVGDECSIFDQSHVGGWIHIPQWQEGMHKLDSDDYWILNESLVDDRNTNTTIKPYVIEVTNG